MRAVAEGGLPLDRFMVGTGVPALDDTVRLTRAACELGFAGALVLPPFFYPQVPDDGLVAYVEALARRVDDPAWRSTCITFRRTRRCRGRWRSSFGCVSGSARRSSA